MKTRLLATVLLVVTACGPASRSSEAPSSSPAPQTASPEVSVIIPTPAPTQAPTPEPPARVTRAIAGTDFAIVDGAADLRIEAVLSRAEEAILAATVAADIPAVERESSTPSRRAR